MNWWQWTVSIVLLVIVVSLVDGLYRVPLQSDVTVTKLDSKKHSDNLVVYIPGLVADGEWSSRNLVDTWRSFGDVWLVNPINDRFKDEFLATSVAELIEQDSHPNVIFIGSSLGAHVTLQVMDKLSPAKVRRTSFGLVPVCTPGRRVHDIKQPLKSISGLTSVLRFGPLANKTWGKLFTRSITGKQPRTFAMTFYVDQVNYIRSRQAPTREQLAELDVVYLQAEHDELVMSSAASAWTTPDNVIVVNSKHAAYDANPKEWNAAFTEALSRLT